MRHPAHRRSLVEAAMEVKSSGMSPGNSGNLSIRVPGGFLITPSGVPFETLGPSDTVLLGPTGEIPGDRLRPSTEWPLHAAIYADRTEAVAIVHVHSPHATAIACLRREIPAFHYLVAAAGGDSIRCSKYETFGTEELALAALEALEDRRACLLANHGQVALGTSLEDAVRLARVVEDLSHTWSVVLETGDPVLLSAAEIQRVAERLEGYGQGRDPARRRGGIDTEAGRSVGGEFDARPTLSTDRLTLRPFVPADAPVVRKLAGAREVADNTLTIPHPYPAGEAEKWISGQPAAFQEGELVVFAITTPDHGLVGAVGLMIDAGSGIAELGYWIGVPYWGRGYATEAASAVVEYGFRRLALQRIAARAFSRNPASARVLEKIGMQHEGTQRKGLRKNGELLDTELYAVLREDQQGGKS
ncbi:MAG: GNAT family N-acetyltransferase [Gemmatimonadota bacterium]